MLDFLLHAFLGRYNCDLYWGVGFMLCVVRKPDVNVLDTDIPRTYRELCIPSKKIHYLFSHLTEVSGVVANGECNDLSIGVFEGGTNLVNIQFFGYKEGYELVANPWLLGTTTHF